MSTITKINLVAVEVNSFGKAEFVYRPTCAVGENLVKIAVAMSRKPDSKRQTLSLPMLKALDIDMKRAGKEVQFVISGVKKMPRIVAPKIGSSPLDTVSQSAAAPTVSYDFL